MCSAVLDTFYIMEKYELKMMSRPRFPVRAYAYFKTVGEAEVIDLCDETALLHELYGLKGSLYSSPMVRWFVTLLADRRGVTLPER